MNTSALRTRLGAVKGRRFAILSALAFAAIVALAAYSLFAIHRALSESALSRRASLADLTAATLSEKFNRAVDVGVSLATRVRFRDLIEAGEWPAAAKILRDAPADLAFIDRIGLIDLEGTLMAGVPEVTAPGRQNFADRDWYQAARRGKPQVSDVFKRGASPQVNVIVAAVPIRSAKGAPLGVLVVQMAVAKFFDWIRAIDVGEDGLVYVIDRRGTLAFHPTLRLQEQLVDFSAVPVVQQALQGRRGVERSINPIENEERVSAYAPVMSYGWGVVVAEPAAAVFGTRNRLLGMAVVAYLLVLAFFIAFVTNRIAMQRERAAEERRLAAEQTERLRLVHEIGGAIVADAKPEAIAAAVLPSLRKLLTVRRAIVNMIDIGAGEAEWMAAAGRHRTHVGPGVRFPVRFLGDVEALKRGEPQTIDTRALPPGPERDALLASGVDFYMAVPMIAGGELIGALSFGGEQRLFPEEQVRIAHVVATQLAIAIVQARLLERVRRHADELEGRVAERTAELDSLNRDLADLYDNAPCGYHSVDANGVFVRMNETELKWLGYSRDEVVGKMGPADLHTPASLENFKQRFEAFRKTGIAKDFEYEFRRKDGSVLPVVLNATAVRDRDGNFLMSRSTIFDNTERKRVALALRDSEKEMRMLQETTLAISEAEGSKEAFAVLLRKVCEYFGWSFAQAWLPDEGQNRLLLGAAWYSSIAELGAFRKANESLGFAPRAGVLEQVWRSKRAGWDWDLKPLPAAVRRPLMLEAGLKSWIGVPVLADGDVIAVIEFFDYEYRQRDEGVLRLISILTTQLGPVIQRKRATEQIDALNASLKVHAAELEAANRELEAFSYSVSHDLRAPLRAVDGYALMLSEDYAKRLDDEGRRLLGVVREEARRMGLLIDDLLRFSQIGRKPLALAPVDMRALAAEAVGELSAAYPKVRVDLRDLPVATGDRALLKHVWMNLVGNALKYSAQKDSPRVEISGRASGSENIYTVRDNGAGFDMRYYEKLFKVFQRLHREDEFEGTGVGLAIVQRVVARHGGRVWGEGTPGEGASFHFALPVEG